MQAGGWRDFGGRKGEVRGRTLEGGGWREEGWREDGWKGAVGGTLEGGGWREEVGGRTVGRRKDEEERAGDRLHT